MARLLTLGFIGIVLMNVVVGLIAKQNDGFIVIKKLNHYGPNDMEENDYVEENYDDLAPSGKPKMYDPQNEYDPSLNLQYLENGSSQNTEQKPVIANRFGSQSEEPNIPTGKPKGTEKPLINTETLRPAEFPCPFNLCKLDQAWKSAQKELDKNWESFMNARKSAFGAKIKFLQSLPEATHTFVRTLINPGEKS